MPAVQLLLQPCRLVSGVLLKATALSTQSQFRQASACLILQGDVTTLHVHIRFCPQPEPAFSPANFAYRTECSSVGFDNERPGDPLGCHGCQRNRYCVMHTSGHGFHAQHNFETRGLDNGHSCNRTALQHDNAAPHIKWCGARTVSQPGC